MTWSSNLPSHLSTFIGREREADDLLSVLSSARLVTLTGPGGAGKTRLAIEAAGHSQALCPDGAWFVYFGSVFEPALVAGTVAAALGVREEPGARLQDTIAAFLAPRAALLLLDNCEHLLKTCAELAAHLLHSCPDLRVLATSREPLALQGETVVRVPPLSVPSATAGTEASELMQYDAVRLFVSRAHQRTGDFSLSKENGVSVALLARQLDGLPLAIELAAARTSVLTVDQIVERLGERFRLLASPDSDVVPRQKTLQATMDWSYGLLSEEEQILFRALSVFAGGFTLDAACAMVAPMLDEPAVIELLSQFAGKSLVSLNPSATPARYRILETIRRYALIRARESGEIEVLRNRHLEWYTVLAERSEDRLLTSEQGEALARLAAEYDNMRAALAWALESLPASRDQALRLAGSLGWFWYFRGYLSEGREWLDRVLSSVGDLDASSKAGKALSAGGVMAYLQTDNERARARLESAVAFWTRAGDKRGLAFALTFLARVLDRLGDPRGLEMGERSVELFRQSGDKWPLALALDFLGEAAREHGAADEAAALHTESLSLYREIGNRWGIALELSHFAQVAIQRGDLVGARRRLEEAAAIQREVGDKWMLAWTLHYLAIALAALGRGEAAQKTGMESLGLFREAGDRIGIAAVLAALSRAAFDNGQHEHARAYAEESIAVSPNIDYTPAADAARVVLGRISVACGEHSDAATLLYQALRNARHLGDVQLTTEALLGLAELASSTGDWHQTARAVGALESISLHSRQGTINTAQGRSLPGQDDARLLPYRAEIEQIRSMSPQAAIAVVLDEPEPHAHARPHISARARPAESDVDPSDLTERETEVLALLAEGLTDAQIAERLVLSARTVQAHLRSIYSKLDVTTRTAAARYALTHDLA